MKIKNFSKKLFKGFRKTAKVAKEVSEDARIIGEIADSVEDLTGKENNISEVAEKIADVADTIGTGEELLSEDPSKENIKAAASIVAEVSEEIKGHGNNIEKVTDIIIDAAEELKKSEIK